MGGQLQGKGGIVEIGTKQQSVRGGYWCGDQLAECEGRVRVEGMGTCIGEPCFGGGRW